MWWYRLISGLAVCALFFVTPACGGGSKGTGGFSAGPNSNRTISSLSESEYVGVCSEIRRFVKVSLDQEFICTFAGIFSGLIEYPEGGSAAGQTCEMDKQMCIETGIDDGEDDLNDCPLAVYESTRNCSATIEELESCIEQSVQVLEMFLAELDCSFAVNPDRFEAKNAEFNQFETPSCDLLMRKCPELLSEE